MIDLIRKRHPGEGWIVFQELANSTGARVRGWADAAALGVWPSSKYELHGYEIKSSREDLKREIRDPSKADNVGRYCHFWWLVLADQKLMDGLVIPGVWGILVPRGKILRIIRPSPRSRKPQPFDAGFAVAMIRNIAKTWVPRHEHDRVRDATLAAARAEARAEVQSSASEEERRLRELRDKVKLFKEVSGIDLEVPHLWEIGNVGRAVKAVARAHRIIGRQPSLAEMVRREAETIANVSERHREAARTVAAAAQQVREFADRLATDEDAGLEER